MKTDEQVVAERYTTFDGVVPERLWIGVRNTGADKKLEVVAEINGIEKVLWSMKPSYAERDHGIVSDFTNLSWLLGRANPPRVEGEVIEVLRSLRDAWSEYVSDYMPSHITVKLHRAMNRADEILSTPQPAPDERKVPEGKWVTWNGEYEKQTYIVREMSKARKIFECWPNAGLMNSVHEDQRSFEPYKCEIWVLDRDEAPKETHTRAAQEASGVVD